MKNKIIFLLILVLYSWIQVLAQEIPQKKETDSTEINLDLLKGVSSPASNLVGISNTEVQRPTDVNGFVVSLQNATQSFSKLPSNYAIDFAPAWLFRKKSITIDKFVSNKIEHNIWQSLVLSVAVKSSTTKNQQKDSTQVGLGIKFSIIRGKIKDTSPLDRIKQLTNQAFDSTKSENEKLDDFLDANKEYKDLRNLRNQRVRLLGDNALEILEIEEKMKILRLKYYKTKNFAGKYKELLDSANNLKVIRYGSKLDFAAGFVYDYFDQIYSQEKYVKSAAWLTYAYEPKNGGISILAIARYQYNPDKIFAYENTLKPKTQDVSTFDTGLRLIFEKEKSKFSFSTEGIYRSVLSASQDTSKEPSSWRFTLNASYDVALNTALTFSFGRDFDKTITKDGTLIAALNFIKGFGSKRNISY